MKNVLITGGCGFIGAALAQELLKHEDVAIKIIDNFSVGQPADLQSIIKRKVVSKTLQEASSSWDDKVELFEGDIREFEHCRILTQGADAIVHLAANTGVAPSVNDPMLDCHQNVIGTLNILESARLNKVNKFVFASSGAPLSSLI